MVDTLPDDALTAALDRQLAEAGVDPGPYLEAGEFRLSDSPSFGRDVADSFAQLTGLPRWDEFRRLFAMRDIPKPAKPSPDYIEAEARAIERDPARLPYAIALVADRLGEIYLSKLSDYEAKRKERDHLEQNHENSDLGYIRFLCAENPQAHSFFF